MKVASHSQALVGAGSLGRDLRWGGRYAVHPFHYAAGGLMFATAAYLVSPAVVPAARIGLGAGTGLVPGMGEALQFAQAMKWIRLHPQVASGVAVGGAVGLANLYINRDKIVGFVKDKHDWLFRQIDAETRVEVRDGPSILSQRTSRSPSFGKKRRRCKHRNKAGKQCLRPAGHSGRHRYR